MKQFTLTLLFIVIFYSSSFNQTQSAFNLDLVVTDNSSAPKTLTFGLDPNATDGIDISLGENELPPFPPPGGFEARFYLPKDNFLGTSSSWTDIRQAAFPFTGQKEYRIRYQPGSGSTIIISWNFPQNVTGRLQDVVLGTLIDVNMTGQNSFEVLNPTGFDRLKMIINFNNVISGLETETEVPNNFFLSQNYPNPFNPTTKINYSIPYESSVKLEIFNYLGEKITTLVNDVKQKGNYEIEFNSYGLASGIYFYKLSTEGYVETKKMILQK
jgi:hypothetical protein